ncbi:hypothetical protein BLNAU_15149 [Blattamonas nauphoetae]|uniref:Uncharacterized protein n=1 Tax=Blattamonas nauphoetae TaxID=2049346 RepID=A0ABQ9XFB7_9EUKA|nr:hypothetical protein BLNAU_15149 [Blattamonas nauphoetae]
MEIVQSSYFDWAEWVTMLVMVEKGERSLTDHSFLQSRCLRSTLLSLQTKHQLRANPTQIEENHFADSCRLPTTAGIPLLSSALANQPPLPSSDSSSDPKAFIYTQVLFHSDPVVRHSRRILLAIHDLLTRPHPISFPWTIRPSFYLESELDPLLQPFPQSVDLHEKFDTSLFSDTDDVRVVAALRRCRAVVIATKSTKCVSNIHSFQKLLIAGLHSSNHTVKFECFNLFCGIINCLQTNDDPRDVRFASLRTAFCDGEHWEKMALIRLWVGWLEFRYKNGDQRFVNESDFDFSGFLSTELNDVQLLLGACCFVGTLFLNEAMSMSFRWQLDFLQQFEEKNQMLSRIASDPRLLSRQEPFNSELTPITIKLGTTLSITRGCDFPLALTEIITTDSDTNLQQLSFRVNPAFFLNHTSINPKHQHSFFPMDLMFERYLRSDPDVFFEGIPDVSFCTSRKFLHTPYVGLHSLLLRCLKLNLDQESLQNLVRMLFVPLSHQDTTQKDIHRLFYLFPPPRLFDNLLSSPLLDKSRIDVRICFLALFGELGAVTAPFRACLSLAKVFKMLIPFKLDSTGVIYNLAEVGDQVVSLHWLNIPAHFDSPLLCHLPSLADAQQDIVQTLSSYSGIPSLVTPRSFQPNWNLIRTIIPPGMSPSERLHMTNSLSSPIGHSILEFITTSLLSPIPGVVSAAIEFFHRFVSVASDDVRMDLVRNGLLDSVVYAVSCSSFLDDYEKGVAVIGMLLATIRRDCQKRRMQYFDFLHLTSRT